MEGSSHDLEILSHYLLDGSERSTRTLVRIVKRLAEATYNLKMKQTNVFIQTSNVTHMLWAQHFNIY
jgi:TolB-like protein